MRTATFVTLVCCLGAVSSCGGTPDVATKNETFYKLDSLMGGGALSPSQLEKPYPPLNLAAIDPTPEYLGKWILRDGVRISRPKDWMIREASIEPGHAYIQYISPRAYSFAVYERPEPATSVWREVIQHYEEDAASVGATITGKRVPIGFFRGQGRAFSVQRKIDMGKQPLLGNNREYLVRGEHRIVLVQIAHEGNDMSGVDQELMRVISTLEVL